MTDLDLRAGQIHRGLGIVARWPNIALVIPSEPAHDGVVDEMFDTLNPNPTSQQIIRAINALLAENRLKSVGMVVEATGGPMAVAYGGVEIIVDGELAMSGANGLVKQQVPSGADQLTIRSANLAKAAEPVPPFDLRRGIAPGGGLTLLRLAAVEPPALSNRMPGHAAPAPSAKEAPSADPAPPANVALAGAPAPGPEPEMEAPFRSVSLIDVAPPAEITPLPITSGADLDEAEPAPSLGRGRVEVEGILCSRQHFNNPQSAYCMVCGVSLAHLTPNRVVRPRPTLGFIVFDDGSSFGLDRSYLIGREPVRTEDQDAELLMIHDNNDTLSRTHAELRLADWSVQLIDLGSTNGTYIWDQDNERWNQLTAGHAVELHSGETVALGRRTFVFEGVGQLS